MSFEINLSFSSVFVAFVTSSYNCYLYFSAAFYTLIISCDLCYSESIQSMHSTYKSFSQNASSFLLCKWHNILYDSYYYYYCWFY